MGIRQTHTYVVMEVSESTFNEIRAQMLQADYRHAFMDDGQTIDMHGIAVTCVQSSLRRCIPFTPTTDEGGGL